MGHNQLQPRHIPVLSEQLGKFPALKRLDVSANPGLGCGGAAVIFSALCGELQILNRSASVIMSFTSPSSFYLLSFPLTSHQALSPLPPLYPFLFLCFLSLLLVCVIVVLCRG